MRLLFLFVGGCNLVCKAAVVQRVPYTIMVGCLLWTKSPLSSHSLCPRINDEGIASLGPTVPSQIWV
ncbi:hypothetical protein AHAS_Ahas19G0271100 [Arachis hypogaea]